MATLAQIQQLAQQRSEAIRAGDQARAAELTRRLEQARQEFDAQQATQAPTQEERERAIRRVQREQARREAPSEREAQQRLEEIAQQQVTPAPEPPQDAPTLDVSTTAASPVAQPEATPIAEEGSIERVRELATERSEALKRGDVTGAERISQELARERELVDASRSGVLTTQERVRFMQENVQLDTGEFVSREFFNSLTRDQQQLLMQAGVDAFNRAQSLATQQVREQQQRQRDVLKRLEQFESDPGEYAISRALAADAVTPDELRAAGFPSSAVDAALEQAKGFRELARVGIIPAPELIPAPIRSAFEQRLADLQAQIAQNQARRDAIQAEIAAINRRFEQVVAQGVDDPTAVRDTTGLRFELDRLERQNEQLQSDANALMVFLNDGGILLDQPSRELLARVQEQASGIERLERELQREDMSPAVRIQTERTIAQLREQLNATEQRLQREVARAAENPIANLRTDPDVQSFIEFAQRSPGEAGRRIAEEIATLLLTGLALSGATRAVTGVARASARPVVRLSQAQAQQARALAAQIQMESAAFRNLQELRSMSQRLAGRTGELMPAQMAPAEEALARAALQRELGRLLTDGGRIQGQLTAEHISTIGQRLTPAEMAAISTLSVAGLAQLLSEVAVSEPDGIGVRPTLAQIEAIRAEIAEAIPEVATRVPPARIDETEAEAMERIRRQVEEILEEHERRAPNRREQLDELRRQLRDAQERGDDAEIERLSALISDIERELDLLERLGREMDRLEQQDVPATEPEPIPESEPLPEPEPQPTPAPAPGPGPAPATEPEPLTMAEQTQLTHLLQAQRERTLTANEVATLTRLLTRAGTAAGVLTARETDTLTRLGRRTRTLTATQAATLNRIATRVSVATGLGTGVATSIRAATAVGAPPATRTTVGRTPRTPRRVILPDGTEVSPPRDGLWPRVVQYDAGTHRRIIDLYDGSKSRAVLLDRPARGEGVAYRTFKVLEWDTRRPRKTRKDSGAVDPIFFVDETTRTVRLGFRHDMSPDVVRRESERPRSVTPRIRRR